MSPRSASSVAGKRNGFNSHKDHKGKIIDGEIASEETRGKLYMWMKEVIEITKPKLFIAENVKGLVNLSNVKKEEGTEPFVVINAGKAGYAGSVTITKITFVK